MPPERWNGFQGAPPWRSRPPLPGAEPQSSRVRSSCTASTLSRMVVTGKRGPWKGSGVLLGDGVRPLPKSSEVTGTGARMPALAQSASHNRAYRPYSRRQRVALSLAAFRHPCVRTPGCYLPRGSSRRPTSQQRTMVPPAHADSGLR